MAAARELGEELALDPVRWPESDGPLFITVTETVREPHVDVSLWYVFTASLEDPIELDPAEFHGGRWWPLAEVTALVADGGCEPQLARFAAKLEAISGSRPTSR